MADTQDIAQPAEPSVGEVQVDEVSFTLLLLRSTAAALPANATHTGLRQAEKEYNMV